MSAPEPAAGVVVRGCSADLIEIAALRAGAAMLAARAAQRGLPLPAPRTVVCSPVGVALCVRPQRWLLLQPSAAPGSRLAEWREACRGAGAAVELSSGLNVLHLAGGALHEVLSRGCRLDLDARVFPAGTAAATLMAQVAVTLARLRGGMLLVTPSTTARHLREWLAAAARGFGMAERADVTVAALCGDEAT